VAVVCPRDLLTRLSALIAGGYRCGTLWPTITERLCWRAMVSTLRAAWARWPLGVMHVSNYRRVATEWRFTWELRLNKIVLNGPWRGGCMLGR